MSLHEIAKFSISMPVSRKKQVEQRITGAPAAEDRSSVIARDLDRLYNGLLKQGLKTLRAANLTKEERTCLGALLSNTAFVTPHHITVLLWLLEDAQDEIRSFDVDPAALLEKIRVLDLVALYALVDLIERDSTMNEVA